MRGTLPVLAALLITGCATMDQPAIEDTFIDGPGDVAWDPSGDPGAKDVAADTEIPTIHDVPDVGDAATDPGVEDVAQDPGLVGDSTTDTFVDVPADAGPDTAPDAWIDTLADGTDDVLADTPADGPADTIAEASDPGPEVVQTTCIDLTFGTCAAKDLSCECCPYGGPANHCLCSTPCMTNTDCTDAARPVCQQPGVGSQGFCAPADFGCCWMCL